MKPLRAIQAVTPCISRAVLLVWLGGLCPVLAAGASASAVFPGLTGESREVLLRVDRATVKARKARMTIRDGDTAPASSVMEDTYQILGPARQEAAAGPGHAQALERVRDLRMQHRHTGDPRYLGFADTLLQPWRGRDDAPAAVLLAQADLLQAAHRFAQADDRLHALLARDPHADQAWLMKAMLAVTRGDYPAARNNCARLLTTAPSLVSATCIALVAGLTGDGEPAYRVLSNALLRDESTQPDMRAWALSVRADIAARLGWSAKAEDDYQAALALLPDELSLRARFALFHFEEGRFEDAQKMLNDGAESPVFDLTRARICAAQARPRCVASLAVALSQNFAALAARAETGHAREEALYALDIAHSPQRALKLARTNWQVQREPEDLRLLWRAAQANHAAKDPVVVAMAAQSRAEVTAWLASTGLQDRYLADQRALDAQVTAVSRLGHAAKDAPFVRAAQ